MEIILINSKIHVQRLVNFHQRYHVNNKKKQVLVKRRNCFWKLKLFKVWVEDVVELKVNLRLNLIVLLTKLSGYWIIVRYKSLFMCDIILNFLFDEISRVQKSFSSRSTRWWSSQLSSLRMIFKLIWKYL